MNVKIEEWLREKIGLDAASLGSGAIAVAVRTRMAACKIDFPKEYEALLFASEAEGRELIEAVVVPETWFFRDQAAFDYLSDWALKKWVLNHPKGVMKLLSIPCSTGEEPLSMAITLSKAGIQRFQVEGVDISERALAIARAGVYGRNSFRGLSVPEREGCFTPVPGATGRRGWKIRDEIKRHLLYRQENLLGPSWNFAKGRYDVIFCRNLMIYLDERSQKLLLERIEEALHPEGLLFVGHSESYIVSKFGFVGAGVPQAFAFRKRGARRAAQATRKKRLDLPASFLERPTPVGIPKLPELKKETLDEEGLLEECERLANEGDLSRAAERLDAYLADHQYSIRALFLMGVVKDAEGKRAEADSLYRKVLYLDPGHHEALLHLRFHARHKGDLRSEKILSNRLERLALDPAIESSRLGLDKSGSEDASHLKFVRKKA